MSLSPQELGTIPEETARVAHAACPKGTLAMRLRDALGELYQDEQFAALYPVEGQPAYEPWRLAVVTVLQYAEGLTDRQAANAVGERMDWKYSLGLELTDPGFDFSVVRISSASGRGRGGDPVARSAPGGVQAAGLAEAPVASNAPTPQDLAQHHLLPEEQIVDTGYVDADLLVRSQQNSGITLLGPVLADNSWQSQADKGFDVAHFHLDWQAQLATRPQGHTSHRWSPAGERMEVVFAKEVCAACPVRNDCTKSSTTGRVLHMRPQAAHAALQARRQEQDTRAFRQAYQTRAGIEATHALAVRGMGRRRARSDGLHKTQLQHVLTAVAINLVRIDAVLTQTPRGKTRRSHLVRLASHPSLQGHICA
jgi:hypothetical protein